MTEVNFKHSQFDTDVIIYVEQVFSVFWAPKTNSTVIIGPGGAAVPVQGSLEEVNAKIKGAALAKGGK